MSLIVTVPEARVPADRAHDLQSAYSEAARGPLPNGLASSTLLRDTADPTLWRIQTVWASRDHLMAMRDAGKPKGVQMFEAAGATPSLCIRDVVAEIAPPASRG